MSMSNWEDAKKRSNYHFNNDIIDKNNIKHIGKFVGSWKKEVDEVSVGAAGPGATSIDTSGRSMAYPTKNAFKKRNKKD